MTKISALIVCAFAFFFVAAQESAPASGNNWERTVDHFFRLYPQEQALLITDNTVYLGGETIWFKAYLWNDREAQLSRNCAIVLKNAYGRVLKKQHLLLSADETHGDVQLPDTLASGFYSLELFSHWSRNFHNEPLAARVLWVQDIKKQSHEFRAGLKPVVMPEGGAIVPNRKNRIAVFCGQPAAAAFTFELFDAMDNLLYQKTFQGAIGVAELAISGGGSYRAKVCTAGTICSDTLLVSGNAGISLTSVRENEVMLRVTVPASEEEYFLVSCTSDRLVAPIGKVEGETEIAIDLSPYPTGVVHVLLCSSKGVHSTRAFYRPELTEKFTACEDFCRINQLADTTAAARVTLTAPSDVAFCGLAVPSEGFAGYFTLPGLIAHEKQFSANDLLLFTAYPLTDALTRFLKGAFISVSADEKMLFSERTFRHPHPFQPLAIAMSGFTIPGKLDSVLSYKRRIRKIKTSYPSGQSLPLDDIPVEEIYVPDDYPTVKTIESLLMQAIPRLKSRGGIETLHFLYTNLKGQKSLYEEPAALVVDGRRIRDFSLLKRLPLRDVRAIGVIYNPAALLKHNLNQILPSGAIVISLRPGSTAQAMITNESPLFSLPFSWPHAFRNAAAEHPQKVFDNRFPFFSSVYFWNPAFSRNTGMRDNSFVIPGAGVPVKLFLFSLPELKVGRYAECQIR